ncbi:hypothetical protein B0A55_03150 [Friedmanniomyces simplex]|uniref:HECT-type E3 ubiquitin transferase n=1 Tax=Friedmanniomyces simplex TaxID=329884 RepID=A0A4U0XR76_9PEZI|nr:hypothetical protein B0A55_03150 [Friedmanniomyces simplex]
MDTSALQDLLSRLVGQLVHGCGNVACRECMCDTGRRNVSPHKPIRKYTPRSARAIALALAGGALPRKHLCLHYSPAASDTDPDQDDSEALEGPQDPSSFEQLLCDTPSIRDLCNPKAKLSLRPTKLEYWKQSLNPLLQPIAIEDDVPSSLVSNKRAADIVYNALKACLDIVPEGTLAQYSYADAWIRDGGAYPTGNLTTPTDEIWLGVLDSFERGQDLLSRVCEAVAIRVDLEERLQILRSRLNGAAVKVVRPTLVQMMVKKFGLDLSATVQAVVWLKKTLMLHWNGKPSVPQASTATGALILLKLIKQLAWHDLPNEVSAWFSLPAIANNLAVVDVANSWIANSPKDKSDRERSFDSTRALRMTQEQNSPHPPSDADAVFEQQLLSSDYLFNAAQRALYFRMVNHLKMRKAHSKAEKAAALRRHLPAHSPEYEPDDQVKHEEEHYLLLNVSRTDVLQDAYDQLWQRRSGELFRPLRVRLGEVDELEVGHDLGGVQIEFFNLICKEAFAEHKGLFATNEITGLSYFRVGSLQPLHMFELLGLLLALAVYNGITLPFSLPNAFYKLLLGDRDLSLDDLADHWPEEAKSLRYIMGTPGAEEDFEFSFPIEANGVRIFAYEPLACCIESDELNTIRVAKAVPTTYPSTEIDVESLQWPGFHFICPDGSEIPSVTAADKERYSSSYVSWLAIDSVAPQLRAFQRGFHRVVDKHSLSIFLTPTNLKAFMEGSTHLDIDELRKSTHYDGYDPMSKYIATFWRVVKSWPEEKQKQLLKFVTAAERVPLGGPGQLTFVVQRAQPISAEYLPTSSTCFGALQLPQYPNARVLEEKLSLAIEYGLEGFGTG